MSRSRRTTAAAVLGCSLLAVAAAAPADAAASGPAAFAGTSGYAAQGGRFTSVAASWTQPALSCAGGAATGASYWVGLDGMTDSTVEQAGTSTGCSGGVASMWAWYELYPAAPVDLTGPVSAGDRLSASVSTDGTGTFSITVTDSTKGWSRTASHALAGAQLSSAEVMTDVPAAGSTGTFPAGVLASFTGATVNGQALGGFSPTAVEAPGTVVSPLTGGEAFTVSRTGAS